MTARRKTVDVESVRAWANQALSRDFTIPALPDSYRDGVAEILERVLHETGNYKGFRYTEWAEDNPNYNRSYRYYY